MSVNVEWRNHLKCLSPERPRVDLHSILRSSGGLQVQRNHRTRLGFGGATDLLWIWWLIKWAIFKVPYEHVQIKQLDSGYTQWDANQLISELGTLEPHFPCINTAPIQYSSLHTFRVCFGTKERYMIFQVLSAIGLKTWRSMLTISTVSIMLCWYIMLQQSDK